MAYEIPMRSKMTGVAITLVAIVVALSALDQSLARVESAELHAVAQRSYLEGSRLLAAGKAGEAADSLRVAHSTERENPDYELTLISALTGAGRTTDAEPLMNEMLQRSPNDGRVNLIAARLMTREGKGAEAEAFYHRAIFGEWPVDAPERRIEARVELIDHLMAQGRKQELLAELISLEAEPSAGAEVRKRLANWFLMAGSPARAAEIYRAMAANDPKDIAAAEGLGEAELEQGQYGAARAAFLQGSFQHPNDASIRSHLETLNTVVALDPTLRQLTSEEKYLRSLRILDMARAGLEECAAGNPLVASASALLSAKAPAHVTNEDAEKVLALAQQAWLVRNDTCGGASPAGVAGQAEALNLLMKKLAL
jgi:tetratricopeptide (TPR) repeat protein